MKGLSTEIKFALNTIIEGLNYNFFSPDGSNDDIESYVDTLDSEKMKKIMESKISSFASAKKILDKWINSPNAPERDTIVHYLEELIKAGDNALVVLRKGLAGSINYDELDPSKHDAAIKAKPIILEAIFDLDSSINELRVKLDNNDLSLKEVDFVLGYPEKFAKGELLDTSSYWKTKLKGDDVLICPFSTEGEKTVISDLGIILPKPPKDKSKILFSDLPKKEQYWRRPELPIISPDNVEAYDEFIKEEFRRRVEGIWFMNNGKPVYLTGNHYFALTYFRMLDDGDFMKFRYAQLKMFYHLEACIVDPRCLGQLFGKSRRTGFTYVILSILLNHSTMKRNNKLGMMSKTGTDGQEAFLKYAYALRSLPFWFKPIIQGKEDSPASFTFSAPADNSKEAKKQKKGNVTDYLNTTVDWRNTTNGSYDSIKLNFYLLDEVFKIEKPNDIIVHMGMIRPTMMPSGRVVGKMFAGSTMGQHNKGGEQGIELINNSYVKDRDPITKKTTSGLYFHFLPAQENMEEFTDIYGYCHTETPPKGTLNVLGEPIEMGSVEYLLAVEEQLRKQSDAAYNEQLRTYPRTVEHMMRDESGECAFNLAKIIEQEEHNQKIPDEQKYIVGNFDWVDGVDSNVEFFPNPKGRFKVAWLPSKADGTEGLKNRVEEKNGLFYPLNKDCVRFGCDPFSLKSTHGEGSKGAIHGKTIIFPEGGAPSNKFVVEYIARPSDETVFFEDVIKVIRYYGAPILVESNRIDLLRHMRNRGYRPFSMNRLDRPASKLNDNEKEYGGQPMSGKDILDSHMNGIGAWIERYVGVSSNEEFREIGEMGEMPFNETLKDWRKFDPDKRTKYDATISSGLAIMACSTEKYKGTKKEKKKVNASGIFRKYSNKGSLSTQIN